MPKSKSEIFKSKFPEFVGVVDFFTSDAEQLNFIDVQANSVEFTTTGMAECGCCSEINEWSESLSWVMDSMTDDEFQDLISLIK